MSGSLQWKLTVESSGLFITFEGMDGSGKPPRCTAWRRGCARWAARCWKPPSRAARRSASKIRRILLDSPTRNSAPPPKLLLYFASRAQNVDEWIRAGAGSRRHRAGRSLYRFLPGLSGLRARSRRRNRGGAGPHRLPRAEAATSPCWWISMPKPVWPAPAPATPPRRTAKPAWTTSRWNSTARLRGLPRLAARRAGARQNGGWRAPTSTPSSSESGNW